MRWLVASLFLFQCSWVFAGQLDQSPAKRDCRYDQTGGSPHDLQDHGGFSLFPVGGYFQPLLADPMEPRLSISYGRMRVRGNSGLAARKRRQFNAGIATLGMDFASYRFPGESLCKGIQTGFYAASYSLLDWSTDSIDLLNTDFRVGFPLSMRSGAYSARFRFYHQSSHLGDEFIINNPGVKRENLSYEALEALGSVDMGAFRLYGGGAFIIRSKPDLDHFMLQQGVEYFAKSFTISNRWGSVRARPVYGIDLRAYEVQDWGLSTHLVAGLEFFTTNGAQRFRFMLGATDGFTPYGQFFTENKAQNISVNFQFDY